MNSEVLLHHAEVICNCMQETLAAYAPENYYDGLITPPDHISLQDCEFPDFITDPLQIIRHVHGEERAKWLEYEDDLEIIMQEIEECSAEITKATTGDDQGDQEGEE